MRSLLFFVDTWGQGSEVGTEVGSGIGSEVGSEVRSDPGVWGGVIGEF
jgi:hypothetical protein